MGRISKKTYRSIPGLISDRDRRDLRRIARLASACEGDYLEIGSYRGASALEIIQGMPFDRRLYCVDVFDDQYPIFCHNLRRCRAWHRVCPMTVDFRQIGRLIDPGQRFAFLFIDNDHTFESSALPLLLLWHRLQRGAYVLWHDYGNPLYPGVKRLVDTLLTYSPFFTVVSRRPGLFVIRKRKNMPAAIACRLRRRVRDSARAAVAALSRYQKASVQQRNGDLSASALGFARIIRRTPDPLLAAGAHFHLGEIASSQKKFVKARRHFESCLAVIPHHQRAREGLKNAGQHSI